MKKNTAYYLSFLIFFVLMTLIACSGKNNKSSQTPAHLIANTPEYLVNEGIIYLHQGDLKMAETQFKKALKKKSTLTSAINGLGIIYLNKSEFRKALEYFQQVTRINPKHFDAYNYIGIIYTELKEYNLAKENLLIAANGETYSTPENAYANLAMLEIKQNRIDSALRYVEKGMAKNDRFAPLYNLKGVICENTQNYAAALSYYEKALSIQAEEDPTILINIGRLYIKMQKIDKAMDTLEKALSKASTPQLKEEIRQLILGIENK